MAKGGGCLKVLGGGVVVIALLLGVGWLRRDAILESTLEDQLSAATGTTAEIEDVDTNPFQGKLALESLTLKSAQKSSQAQKAESPFFKIERLDLSLESGTLFQDTVIIHSLAVSGIEIELSPSNVAKLADQVQKESSSDSESSAGSGSGKTVEIAELRLQDIKASVRLPIIGSIQTLTIDDVVVNDIDSYNAEGKLATALTSAVFGTILDELPNTPKLGDFLR